MKKCVSLLMCIALLTALAIPMAIPAGAIADRGNFISTLGTSEYAAPDISSIEAGEASFGDLDAIKTPTLDGEISKNEYREVDLIDAAQYMGVCGNQPAWDAETLAEFADVCDTLIRYWGSGWDGKYLYFAFEVNTENIEFYNALNNDNVYLYANTCFQIGVADVDATGKNYSETGYGISTADGYEGRPVSFAWSGNYSPVSGEDFVCSWDKAENTAVYEIRINLTDALGHTVETGSQIKIAWCYMIGEGVSNTGAIHSLLYAHGITGRMSSKNATAFASLTLTGDPENVGDDAKELTEEQIADNEHGLKETIDLTQQKVSDLFAPEINNATVTYMTEGDVSFTRFTATEDDALVMNSVYPRAVNAGVNPYVAIRYRTSDPGVDELYIAYLCVLENTDYDTNLNGDYIYNDGTWRTLVLDMSGAPGWSAFVSELAFMLPKGEIDIQWVKFFEYDVFDYYYEETPADATVTETETETATETEAPETASESDVDMSETEAVTDAEAVTTSGSSSGCGSVLALSGACVLIVLCGGAVALKKRK